MIWKTLYNVLEDWNYETLYKLDTGVGDFEIIKERAIVLGYSPLRLNLPVSTTLQHYGVYNIVGNYDIIEKKCKYKLEVSSKFLNNIKGIVPIPSQFKIIVGKEDKVRLKEKAIYYLFNKAIDVDLNTVLHTYSIKLKSKHVIAFDLFYNDLDIHLDSLVKYLETAIFNNKYIIFKLDFLYGDYNNDWNPIIVTLYKLGCKCENVLFEFYIPSSKLGSEKAYCVTIRNLLVMLGEYNSVSNITRNKFIWHFGGFCTDDAIKLLSNYFACVTNTNAD